MVLKLGLCEDVDDDIPATEKDELCIMFGCFKRELLELEKCSVRRNA